MRMSASAVEISPDGVSKLKVRLIADAGVGGNWLEAH